MELLLALVERYAVATDLPVAALGGDAASVASCAVFAPLPARTRLLLLLRHQPALLPVLAERAGLSPSTVEEKYLPRLYAAGWLEPTPVYDGELKLSTFGEWVAHQEAERVGLHVLDEVLATVPTLPS